MLLVLEEYFKFNIMIKDKILFILGAGSSTGLGYPTGPSLCKRIIGNFENHTKPFGNRQFPENEWFSSFEALYEEGLEFKSKLSEALNADPETSIDLFLARHKPDYDKIGAFLISLSIPQSSHSG